MLFRSPEAIKRNQQDKILNLDEEGLLNEAKTVAFDAATKAKRQIWDIARKRNPELFAAAEEGHKSKAYAELVAETTNIAESTYLNVYDKTKSKAYQRLKDKQESLKSKLGTPEETVNPEATPIAKDPIKPNQEIPRPISEDVSTQVNKYFEIGRAHV